jgi:hypothetical protein
LGWAGWPLRNPKSELETSMKASIIAAGLFFVIGCNPVANEPHVTKVMLCDESPNQEQADKAAQDWCQACLINPKTAIVRSVKIDGRGGMLIGNHGDNLFGTTQDAFYGWVVSFEANSDEGFGMTGFKPHRLVWNQGKIRYLSEDYGTIKSNLFLM